MDFNELLDRADYNTTKSSYKGNTAGIVKYSSVLPPPKKVPKANVQSENIKRFLEKRKREEEAKIAEAKKQREQLLALRAQSTKNSKKAKIMASRTKDNDFSRIKLTDDEIEAKKKREAELIRKNLAGKVERMKARIEMEEKEKLLPRKRKRKSKNGEIIENVDDHHEDQNRYKESTSNEKICDRISSDRTNNVRKPPRPPPPNLSITELLKLAEKKQHEPMDVVIKKKEEEKLMTKKERKIMEEDLARRKRKQESLLAKGNGNSSKSLSSAEAAHSNKTKTVQNSQKSEGKKPLVIHVEKDVSKSQRDESKFKIPKSGVNAPSSKNVPISYKDSSSNSNVTKLKSNNSLSEKSAKSSLVNGHKKMKPDERVSAPQELNTVKKISVPKQNGLKVSKSSEVVKKSEPRPKLDEEALTASIEKRIRDRMEKEMEERMRKKMEERMEAMLAQALQTQKASETPKPVKKEPVNIKKTVEKPSVNSKKDIERMDEIKKMILEQRNNKPKLPEKKPFHKNPYLDPPRRLLEPQRPPKPMKRRIESDDDEDDDDDDMSDFIDDGPSQNEEDYSKYIKEIFGYDRSRYEDIDDDDIKESSFAEQLKEEVRSARLGYLEDLEEERLEMEREKRKKKKKKK